MSEKFELAKSKPFPYLIPLQISDISGKIMLKIEIGIFTSERSKIESSLMINPNEEITMKIKSTHQVKATGKETVEHKFSIDNEDGCLILSNPSPTQSVNIYFKTKETQIEQYITNISFIFEMAGSSASVSLEDFEWYVQTNFPEDQQERIISKLNEFLTQQMEIKDYNDIPHQMIVHDEIGWHFCPSFNPIHVSNLPYGSSSSV